MVLFFGEVGKKGSRRGAKAQRRGTNGRHPRRLHLDREGWADLSGSRGPGTRERIATAIGNAGRSRDRDGADRDVGPTLGWTFSATSPSSPRGQSGPVGWPGSWDAGVDRDRDWGRWAFLGSRWGRQGRRPYLGTGRSPQRPHLDREGWADLSGSRGPGTRERIATAIWDAGRSGGSRWGRQGRRPYRSPWLGVQCPANWARERPSRDPTPQGSPSGPRGWGRCEDREGQGRAGIPAGMHGSFDSVSGGVAALNHRLPAGMPPASV